MDIEATRHISLFALAPIPLLVLLGRCLSNKITVEFYQRHRTGDQPWKWQTSAEPVSYETRMLRKGSDDTKVALVLSLSGVIHQKALPIDERFTIYEITLSNTTPNVEFLRQRRDLEEFRIAYRGFLAKLMSDHPNLKTLSVFPAVPAPVAVVCGHDLLPKVHPSLTIYDYDKAQGGFINTLKINDHDSE